MIHSAKLADSDTKKTLPREGGVLLDDIYKDKVGNAKLQPIKEH
jgi:hypothetical protein